MNALRFLLLLSVVALAEPFTVSAQTPGPAIYGVVVSSARGPIGGVTVSLVHPVVGRSAPSFSAPNGQYYFGYVPAQTEPYFIEAYWGTQLLYRSQIFYPGTPMPFNIPLP